MNKANEQYLFENFKFFNKRRLQCYSGEYLHCGDGWFEIIKELCEKIQALNLKKFKVTQVKEKLGGLRFYFECPKMTKEQEEALIKLVSEAELKSDNTCEFCGKPGKLRKIDWLILTRCDDCVDSK